MYILLNLVQLGKLFGKIPLHALRLLAYRCITSDFNVIEDPIGQVEGSSVSRLSPLAGRIGRKHGVHGLGSWRWGKRA